MRDRDIEQLGDPDQLDLALTSPMISMNALIDQCREGRITQEQLEKQLKEVFTSLYLKTLAEEQERGRKEDQQLGVESLATDTHGGRSLEWFTETGLAFATGVPTSGVACAVLHPDIGMGAAHRNLVTIDDWVRFIVHSVYSPPYATISLGGYKLDRAIVSSDSLKRSVEQTVEEAISEFALLATYGIPQSGTRICLVGGDFLTEQQQTILKIIGLNAVKSHPTMNDGRAVSGKRRISFVSGLGQANGIIWGGPNHPQYPVPTVYS